MSSCFVEPDADSSASLGDFVGKSRQVLDGPRPQLGGAERTWIRAFERVAGKFPHLTREESFSLSLTALDKCREKGHGNSFGYVIAACRNEHLNYVREFGD